MGWTMQIGPELLDGSYGFPIDQSQLGWIGSIISLGAAFFSLFVGFFCDMIGRKKTKLLMVIPLTVGWGLVLLATDIKMLYAGRVLSGMMAGGFVVTAPLYCHEICEDHTRGQLGSLTQLMISFGLLFNAISCKFLSLRTFTLLCFTFPLVFAAFFLFMPETPVYYLKKKKEAKARRALRKLRGPHYDVDQEILAIRTSLEEEAKNHFHLLMLAAKKRATWMGFMITLIMMMLNFLCGVDFVIAFTANIFTIANKEFDPQIGPIIVISLQTLFGIIQTLLVDRIGRRILLLVSQVAIAASMMAVGISFSIQEQDIVQQESGQIALSWIPLIALCTFFIGYAVGLGPIPLLLNAELNPHETKSIVTSFNTFVGWILAFLVAKTYFLIEEATNLGGPFFLYGGISALGIIFIVLFVPETNRKPYDDIQSSLETRTFHARGI